MTKPKSTCVILNPVAGAGSAGAQRDMLKAKLSGAISGEGFKFLTSTHHGHITELVASALKGGADRIIIIGGDGSISEAVNGFFEGSISINANATLGIINMGTGSDFVRSANIGKTLDAQIATIFAGYSQFIDLGTVRCHREDGSARHRFYINLCTFGLSGEVIRRVDALRQKESAKTGLFGGRFSYVVEAIRAIRQTPHRRVVFSIDGRRQFSETVALVGVANGGCCGGGVKLAPMANISDGKLNGIFVGDVGLFDLLVNLPRLFRGTHLRHARIDHVPMERLEASPLDPAPITVEADGEVIGQLPIDIGIQPRALKLLVRTPS